MAQSTLGFVETRGFVGLVEATDAMLKAANVRVVKYERIGAGLLAVVVEGDVGAVRVAVDAGVSAASSVTEAKGTVIPNPAADLRTILEIQAAVPQD